MLHTENYLYNSVDVAKYIVAYANDNKIVINITKVQKLLYIAYGIYLVAERSRLTDEQPQAWPYGPVFPTTRRKLLDLELASIKLTDSNFQDMNKDEDFKNLIKLVFDAFGSWSAAKLTKWSHNEGTPWWRTVNLPDFEWGDTISNSHIEEYFNTLIYGEE